MERKIVFGAAAALLACAAFLVLRPFLTVLGAAAVIAVVCHPLYDRLERRLSPTTAAALAAATVCLALLAPMGLGVWYAARESVRAFPLIREAVGARLPDLDLRGVVLENLADIGAWSRATAANAATLAMDALVFALFVFAFLRGGRDVVARLRSVVPASEAATSRVLERARDTVVAVVEGVFAVALVQGALSAAGFALFGVRFPALLGGLCAVLSPIPVVGPTLVWLPVVIELALGGETTRALLLAGWFAGVVSLADNIVRPLLIGSRARLPVPVVVLGALGGVKAFGAIGMFLGPVVMAVAVACADALAPSRHDS